MWWFIKRRRRQRVGNRPFRAEWVAIMERNVPYYRRLPEADKRELQRHVLIFLAEKQFEGCGGLDITDEIRVTVAAQACILLLHRETDYYPGLSSILVYPEAYVAHGVEHVGDGVLIEGPQVRLGESWHRGSVVLSWDDVRRGAADIHDGHNVVFHEFAHQLDSSGGRGDGSSVLHHHSHFLAWARIMHNSYDRLRREPRRDRRPVLDEYGATSPAEFFAVATESFFERSGELLKVHPELYQELKSFYQQDPGALGD